MSKQKLSNVKSKVKHYMPEIAVGVGIAVGITGAAYITKVMTAKNALLVLHPENINRALVIEQIDADTWKCLDFGTLYRITEITE